MKYLCARLSSLQAGHLVVVVLLVSRCTRNTGCEGSERGVTMLVARADSTVGTRSRRPRKCRTTTQFAGRQMRRDHVNERVGDTALRSSCHQTYGTITKVHPIHTFSEDT